MTASEHARQHGLHTGPGTPEIGADHLLPLRPGRLLYCRRHQSPGIVDENIDPSIATLRLEDDSGRGFGITDIRLNGEPVATVVFGNSYYCVQLIFVVEVIEDQMIATCSKTLGDCQPDALSSASDNDNTFHKFSDDLNERRACKSGRFNFGKYGFPGDTRLPHQNQCARQYRQRAEIPGCVLILW
ncbi:hypothetical protein D3C76_841780 [compost metagenome]